MQFCYPMQPKHNAVVFISIKKVNNQKVSFHYIPNDKNKFQETYQCKSLSSFSNHIGHATEKGQLKPHSKLQFCFLFHWMMTITNLMTVSSMI